ncbi:type II toxin-antitoxin system PemK/MazF family toxin [Zwartia sp.]|uniref:type II toxin-antitoxin system PemK/MazF family toxin n=1 Tax=Zwartia sp. TaxID=2978004 RepID=UPI003BAF2279
MVKKTKDWVPERQEVIWIDCNPQRGREMRDVHPFLVLSPSAFNVRTSLVIGLPMTTAEYNADNPFAVSVGITKIRKTNKSSFVLCHQPKSFDWREREATPHPIGTLSQGVFSEVLHVLNQIVKLA